MRKYLPFVIVGTIILVSACGGNSGESGVANTEGDFVSVSNGYFNNLRVSRDGQGNLLSMISFEVDTDSNRITGTRRDGDEQITHTYQDSYSARGYLLETKIFDAEGQQLLETTFSHDARGYLTDFQTEALTSNDRSTSTSLVFGRHGRLAKKERRDLVSDELLVSNHYSLDARGRFETLERTVYTDDGAATKNVFSYYYDSLDRIIAVDSDIDADGTLDAREHMQFDDNGNVTLFTSLNEAGAVKKTITYEYETTSEPIFNSWMRWHRYEP